MRQAGNKETTWRIMTAKSLVDANMAEQGVSTGKNFRFLAWACHQVVYVTLGKTLNFSASCFLIGFLSWPSSHEESLLFLLPPRDTQSVDSILEMSREPAGLHSSSAFSSQQPE